MTKTYEEYTQEEIDSMRERLAESEWEGLSDKDLRVCLWEGVRGWINIPNDEIIDLYNANFELED
tara:strand:+ start:787 stop:981 length:195 start_codon:yes stop_codon:yes gene_type:complete